MHQIIPVVAIPKAYALSDSYLLTNCEKIMKPIWIAKSFNSSSCPLTLSNLDFPHPTGCLIIFSTKAEAARTISNK